MRGSLCYSRRDPLTAEEVISTQPLPFLTSRYRATVRLFRQLRHDLATPLSGAALHLEVACRRLGQASELDVKRVLENVRMGQLEVGYASAMLEVLSEVVRSGDDEGERFPLPTAVAQGIDQLGTPVEDVSARAPELAPAPVLFGSRRQIAQAAADLTFHALRCSEKGSVVEWEVAAAGACATLVCRWTGSLGGVRPEQIFTIGRDPRGEARGHGLLLARWTVECHGGELGAEESEGQARFVARLPLGGEEVVS